MEDDNIRPPDKIIKQRLIDNDMDDDYPSPHQPEQDDMNILNKIMEISRIEYDTNLKTQGYTMSDQEEEEMIRKSIEEYMEKQEKEKTERKKEMNELRMRVEKIGYSSPTLRNLWTNIIDNYINNNQEETITIIDKEEYTKITEYLDEWYTHPKSKNKKTAITEEQYLKMMSMIFYSD